MNQNLFYIKFLLSGRGMPYNMLLWKNVIYLTKKTRRYPPQSIAQSAEHQWNIPFGGAEEPRKRTCRREGMNGTGRNLQKPAITGSASTTRFAARILDAAKQSRSHRCRRLSSTKGLSRNKGYNLLLAPRPAEERQQCRCRPALATKCALYSLTGPKTASRLTARGQNPSKP